MLLYLQCLFVANATACEKDGYVKCPLRQSRKVKVDEQKSSGVLLLQTELHINILSFFLRLPAETCTSCTIPRYNCFLYKYSFRQLAKKTLVSCIYRPVPRGAQGGRSPRKMLFVPPGKMCWTYFKTIGRSLKKIPPLRKPFAPLVSQAGYRLVYLSYLKCSNHSYSKRGNRSCYHRCFIAF